MRHMDIPGSAESPDWDSLFLYRGSEVEACRPVFTGDVYFDVEVQGVGAIEQKSVIILQHPCALRRDGIHLVDSIMVAEVLPDKFYDAENGWQGNYKIMPLPFLSPGSEGDGHHSANFLSLFLAIPASLGSANRVASMTPLGVNILLQRWVYHNSRGLLPAHKYHEVTIGPYEEADAIEEWCQIRALKGISIESATEEANLWLDDKSDIGVRRRFHFENNQLRSTLRKKMRQAARAL